MVLVCFLFLRRISATLIPTIAVPISLCVAFSLMYVLGYGIDNVTLLGLTIAVGLVVDDAIVVLEAIVRHIEEGMAPIPAAIRGLKEIGFTVLSITLSLVAVFLPILLMGGVVGRVFNAFAATVYARRRRLLHRLADPDAADGRPACRPTPSHPGSSGCWRRGSWRSSAAMPSCSTSA